MKLAELHLHLDGSLRPETVADLAAPLGLAVPPDLGFRPGMGLEAALSKFAFTLSLLQTPRAVRRVASEICEDAARDGVERLEIRFAPQLHREAPVEAGVGTPPPIEAIVDAAVEGAAGRAGILLCGLYGEPPAQLERLVRVASTRPGVVGIDLAAGPLPTHAHRLPDYAPAFALARDLGLGRTVHAAEGRPPHEIRVAVEQLFAQRIGHGTTLLDDPAVVDLVVERGVTIEACPTSNVHTGIFDDVAHHPLPRWLKLGVRACVCADNTLLSHVTTAQEHQRALGIPGMTPELLERAVAYAHAAAFRRA